ncbi:DEAD/DEAH box helicase family protein [Flavobacteriaceae bacterium]|nr:DEAD/DEAH box helicase family protein [Flavobacteriaceae bacterium]
MEKPKKKRIKLKITKSIPELTETNIETIFNENFKDVSILLDDDNYNTFLNKKELLNRRVIFENEDKHDTLYPSLDDSNFNIKIAEKKEFNENKYDGTLYDIEEQARKLCDADFELDPHQLFVRNFLSFQTPYNSLLLYHGLGTGKTCSAISVSEEMRTYLKQLGMSQRIIVVASPNVQDNFRLQLFDVRKLKLVDGLWNLTACTGNKYLKEINPMNMKGLGKDKVIRQITRIINNAYLFLGYTEFANYITKKSTSEDGSKKEMIKKLQRNFSNRLIIIDEVHNIRIGDEKQDKRVAQELLKLVKYADNLRLLFLSATPMYNSYKEVIWLLNVMNMNDRRSTIELKDVFDKNGNLLIGPDGEKIGEEIIRRKSTGYVSFVRGENPYTFPYRIFPSLFSIKNTFKEYSYPRKQLNGREIIQPLEHLDVYVNIAGSYQQKAYEYIIENIRVKSGKTKAGLPNFENMEAFGYTLLQKPLQALNMVYPNKVFDEGKEIDTKILLGSEGLRKTMKFTETTNPPTRKNFEYKPSTYGSIFAPDKIGQYSTKIKGITDNIIKSNGIVLIYSQFIDGGLIPMALALEELGITRFGSKASNLFKTPPRKAVDARTFLSKDEMENPSDFSAATYTMITGEKALSPDTINDLKNLTDEDNKHGEKIKIVLISMTGTEGIDFKNLRQVHILEPWYNLSLIEQIIGRAVRTCSHKLLPFRERNVEIFLYGTIFSNEEEEAADLYIYRLAEFKAVQIGSVSRILKESAVDCILNIDQTNFTEENMNTIVKQQLSNGMVIDFPIGDKPNTVSCDYMETCNFKCKPFKSITPEDIKLDTYNESFIFMNTEKIIQRIRDLFKTKFFYKKDNLISEINVIKNYPLVQINAALDILIEDQNEFISDRFNRLGHLVNIDEYYLFQPIELDNENISLFDRRNPIDYKHEHVVYPLKDVDKPIQIKKTNVTDKSLETKKSKIMSQIKSMINDSLTETVNVPRGEDNWYIYASMLHHTGYLLKNYNITTDDYKKYIIYHILDYLTFNETEEILNYLYFAKDLDVTDRKIKEIYDKQLLKYQDLVGMLLPKDNKQFLLMKGDKNWIPGKQEDYVDLKSEIKQFIIPIDKYNDNNIVGFVVSFKNEYNIFKVKNLKDHRSKGARCDQSGKAESLKLLNSILGSDKYTSGNTKGRNKIEFCILQEFILRNKNLADSKIWYLTPIEAIINNIEKVSL